MRFSGKCIYWLLSVCLALVTAHPALAAAPTGIDKIVSYYSKLSSFASDFQQSKKLESVGMELKGSGRLSVKTGEILWQVREPAPLLVKITPEEISISEQSPGGQTPAAKTQTFSLKDGIAGSRIAASVRPFLELFSGSPEALKKQFTIAPDGDGYALTPLDGELPVKKLVVIPDAGGEYIARVLIFEKSGDQITYEFAKPVSLGSP